MGGYKIIVFVMNLILSVLSLVCLNGFNLFGLVVLVLTVSYSYRLTRGKRRFNPRERQEKFTSVLWTIYPRLVCELLKVDIGNEKERRHIMREASSLR